jgi:hypothetical protein
MLVLELLGRYLVPDPVAEGLAVAAPLLVRFAGAELGPRVLEGLARGAVSVAVQDGWSGWAPCAASCDYVIVVDGDEVAITAPGPGDVSVLDGVDGTRHIGRVAEGAPRLATFGPDAADETRARAAVMTAAVVLGVSRAMIDMAVEYAKQRTQFGRPIGSFQAVKHQLADAFAAVEASRRTAWWASLSLDTTSEDRVEAVSVAKATASESAREASYAALQVHGGIGYTWECDLHLWMKRSQALQGAWGGADTHFRKLGGRYAPTR